MRHWHLYQEKKEKNILLIGKLINLKKINFLSWTNISYLYWLFSTQMNMQIIDKAVYEYEH